MNIPSSFIRTRAFSLVEVVLAIGIVSFAMLAIIGVFGGVMKSSGQNSDRRELAEAIDSLRRTLQTDNFTNNYSLAKDKKSLLYITYHAKANGDPDPGNTNAPIVGKWLPADPAPSSDYDAARSGRWVRAKIEVAPSNPGGTNLSSVASYSNAIIHVQATLETIASPLAVSTNTDSGALVTTLSILR